MSDYDHTPRPHVESHYHIRELIETQEKRSNERQYHREKEKERYEINEEVKAAQLVVVTDFWCDTCKQDFKSMSIKEVEIDWNNQANSVAFYRSKCDQGHWCIRLITDKYRDGFWTRSKTIVRDRGMHYADTIQPHETNFNMLYGKPR